MFGAWVLTYALAIRVSGTLGRRGCFRTRTSVQAVAAPLFFVVALGCPADRVAPPGALRGYYRDDDWRSAFEEIAGRAICIVGMVADSPNTSWELRRIRELGRHEALYLFTPRSRIRPRVAPGGT